MSAELPRIEVIHDLPEHELTYACGCRKHVIGEETSEQLDIVPMQIRVIKHVRKVYGCRGCETTPVTADKPAQLPVVDVGAGQWPARSTSRAIRLHHQPCAGSTAAATGRLSRLCDDR
ncbi:hypothetical protein PPUJ20005_00530 [Pseudomonas putida]|nr:hypothetical protein PPUJ20005_00530 [Pseudomonas putida]GLO23106.1 hypothetical protein PPUJ21368_09320 [Pseudomonas putida]